MKLDRDDIFIQDIIEEGMQEYLEACAGERAALRILMERDASFAFTERGVSRR